MSWDRGLPTGPNKQCPSCPWYPPLLPQPLTPSRLQAAGQHRHRAAIGVCGASVCGARWRRAAGHAGKRLRCLSALPNTPCVPSPACFACTGRRPPGHRRCLPYLPSALQTRFIPANLICVSLRLPLPDPPLPQFDALMSPGMGDNITPPSVTTGPLPQNLLQTSVGSHSQGGWLGGVCLRSACICH